MSEFNVCSLSKLPKEILIKILLQKDNSEYFDLSYCYKMRDKIYSRIEKLKTEEIKRELFESVEDEMCKDFIANITGITTNISDLKFEYLNHKIRMTCSGVEREIHVTLQGKVVYREIDDILYVNKIAFDTDLRKIHKLMSRKIGVYTLFESIIEFLNNDKLELNI